MADELMTTLEVARLLGVKEWTIRYRLRNGSVRGAGHRLRSVVRGVAVARWPGFSRRKYATHPPQEQLERTGNCLGRDRR